MKRIVCTLLAFVMLLSLSSVALASDLGVQVIGGPDVESDTMSLDDIQLGQKYTIDGYAIVEVVSSEFVDSFAQYSKDNAGNNSVYPVFAGNVDKVYVEDRGGELHNASWVSSGANAEFVYLLVNITNLKKQDIDYLSEVSVVTVFDDEYEFAGWIRQINYDYATQVFRYNYDGKYFNGSITIDPANAESIGQLYTGTYLIGCTLPNAVVESKSPLRIEITLGGNEITYNVRK